MHCTDPRGPTPTCTDLHERTAHQALHDFAGSALVVSHDRWFLDRVCTHTLAFDQSGQVIPCTQTYGVDLSIYPVRPASMPSCLARYLHAPRGRLNSSRARSPTTTRGASGGAARSHSKTVRSASGAASRGDSARVAHGARAAARTPACAGPRKCNIRSTRSAPRVRPVFDDFNQRLLPS